MADIYKLEFLSLVATITQEINNHAGINDKTLAEFVINLHDQSKSFPEFKSQLKNVGADFPDSVIENLDRLILQMHPKHKKKYSNGDAKKNKSSSKQALVEKDKNIRLFPGLTMPDQEWTSALSENPVKNSNPMEKEIDSLMSQLENVAKRARPRASDFMNGEKEHSPKRQKRNASLSPPRRTRELSPRHSSNDFRQPPRDSHMDNRPILYKIYNGRVSGVRDFGAFVTLEGVAGKVDGAFPFSLSSVLLLTLV